MAVVFCSYGMQNVVLNETIVIVKSFFMDPLNAHFFPIRFVLIHLQKYIYIWMSCTYLVTMVL